MPRPASLRELTVDDYQRLVELWKTSELESLRPDGRDSCESVARQLTTGMQTILGLEVDERLVGAVVVTHDGRKGWINRLVTHPHARRQGYARRLIAAAEAVLRAQGIHVIGALIEDSNHVSLALFQSAGYTECDPPIHYLSKRDDAGA